MIAPRDSFEMTVTPPRAGSFTEKRARQRVSIGETHDFNVAMDAPGEYAMELRGTTGTLKARQVIHVVP